MLMLKLKTAPLWMGSVYEGKNVPARAICGIISGRRRGRKASVVLDVWASLSLSVMTAKTFPRMPRTPFLCLFTGCNKSSWIKVVNALRSVCFMRDARQAIMRSYEDRASVTMTHVECVCSELMICNSLWMKTSKAFRHQLVPLISLTGEFNQNQRSFEKGKVCKSFCLLSLGA